MNVQKRGDGPNDTKIQVDRQFKHSKNNSGRVHIPKTTDETPFVVSTRKNDTSAEISGSKRIEPSDEYSIGKKI